MINSSITEADVEAELTEVIDPCSISTGDPINIVDLGLIEKIEVTDEKIDVTLLLTTPVCMFASHIMSEIEDELGGEFDDKEIEVAIESEKFWTRDRMSEEEQEKRRTRVNEAMKHHGIEKKHQQES